MKNNRLLRSVLYVPACKQRAIEKSAGIAADWIVFDLEDSVAPESKASARDALIAAFKSMDFNGSQTAIRCNHVDTAEFPADLATVAACRPQAVLLPKVSSVSDIDAFAQQAETVQLAPSVATWFMIETAKGIAQLDSIVREGGSLPWVLTTLVVGHNDIASETGVSLDFERRYIIPWLMQIVLQAKQAELHVLDSVWNRFRDLEGFEAEAMQAKSMGFDGKTLIHPSQVDSANHLFSPSAQEITRAQLIVDTFDDPKNALLNVLNIDGEMVERLHLDQAQRLLEKYSKRPTA